MFRRLVPIIGFIVAGLWAGLGSSPVWAQVNIDQGKSAAEIFNGDCGTCHKSAKGLANGRNSGTLAGFLREHYTSSAQQASSLAAYVLGAGGGPAPSGNLKPGTAGAEAKPGEAKPGEAKTGEKGRPGRPEPAGTAKLQPSAEPDTKIETEPANEAVAPGRKPPAGKREPRPVTASRGARQAPESPPPAPEPAPMGTPETAAPVATAPAAPDSAAPAAPQPALPATAAVPGAVPESSSPPSAASSPAASASAPEGGASAASSEETQREGAPAENAPVPRDDIPD